MRLVDALDEVLGTRGRVRVLRALIAAPESLPASGREIARRTGLAHPQASSILGSFVAQGLVTRHRGPRIHLYDLNRSHVLLPHLEALFEGEAGVRPALDALLRERLSAGPILKAAVFGSAVVDGMDVESDLDLAIVARPGSESEVAGLLDGMAEEVRARFGIRLSPLVSFGEKDAWPKRPPIWRRIEAEGLPLSLSREAG